MCELELTKNNGAHGQQGDNHESQSQFHLDLTANAMNERKRKHKKSYLVAMICRENHGTIDDDLTEIGIEAVKGLWLSALYI